MRELLRSIAALGMAILLLVSTLSFALDMHYCGDHLVDFSFSKQVTGCKMGAQPKANTSICETVKKVSTCCSDIAFVYEGQDQLTFDFEIPAQEIVQCLPRIAFSFINLLHNEEKDSNDFFKDYSPPPLIPDVQALHQTYLI